jgi:hypothetical protein
LSRLEGLCQKIAPALGTEGGALCDFSGNTFLSEFSHDDEVGELTGCCSPFAAFVVSKRRFSVAPQQECASLAKKVVGWNSDG